MSIWLSICIPTKGRVEILKNTLDSIYLDYEGSYDDFEVVISDNATDDLLPQMLEGYNKYPNIFYEKSTSKGFLNSMNALKIGKGLLLKLHNDYTTLNKGALVEMISFVKEVVTLKPLIFFSNFELRNNKITACNSFDTFSYEVSFLNTWSTCFAIWKEDFDKQSKMPVNQIFPHTSLLLAQHQKSSFIVNDTLLFGNQDIPKKGGYNLFEAFACQYLEMMEGCLRENQITEHTFKHIKQDLFKNFLVPWYYNTKIATNQYTFNLSGIEASIKKYYSETHYYLMILEAYKRAFLTSIKKRFLSLLK